MSFDSSIIQNLLEEDEAFENYLIELPGGEDIADEYHSMLRVLKDEKEFNGSDDPASNFYFEIEELVATVTLLKHLVPENSDVKTALDRIIHRYTVNVQAASHMIYFAPITETSADPDNEQMDNNSTIEQEIAEEYSAIKIGQTVFHHDMVQLCTKGGLPRDMRWNDTETMEFVTEKLLPRIHALDAKIFASIAMIQPKVRATSEELSNEESTEPPIPRIGTEQPPVNPTGATITSIEAARAAGPTVVPFLPPVSRR